MQLDMKVNTKEGVRERQQGKRRGRGVLTSARQFCSTYVAFWILCMPPR